MSNHTLQVFESVEYVDGNTFKSVYITITKEPRTLDKFLQDVENGYAEGRTALIYKAANFIRRSSNRITTVDTASKLTLETMRKNLFRYYEAIEPNTVIINTKHIQ